MEPVKEKKGRWVVEDESGKHVFKTKTAAQAYIDGSTEEELPVKESPKDEAPVEPVAEVEPPKKDLQEPEELKTKVRETRETLGVGFALYDKLNFCSGLLGRLEQEACPQGFTLSQARTLMFINEVEGDPNQKHVAEALAVTGGNITMVIDNLAKKSLVERKRSESDRRNIDLQLTQQGVAEARRIRQRFDKVFGDAASKLGDDVLQALGFVLESTPEELL